MNGESERIVPQGLKPIDFIKLLWHDSSRALSKQRPGWVLPQPTKPSCRKEGFVKRVNSYPDSRSLTVGVFQQTLKSRPDSGRVDETRSESELDSPVGRSGVLRRCIWL